MTAQKKRAAKVARRRYRGSTADLIARAWEFLADAPMAALYGGEPEYVELVADLESWVDHASKS